MHRAVPLDQQVIAILTKPATSADAANVRALAHEALAGLIAEAEATDKASLSPLATHAQALDLRGKANDFRFDADRLEASVAALSTRVAELQQAERQAIRAAERDAVVAERDALAADIARDYPRLVRELTVLVQRIEASDARCAAIRIGETAEAIGRKVPANFYLRGVPVPRIADARLPMPGSERLAWQPASIIDGRLVLRGLELPAGDAATRTA